MVREARTGRVARLEAYILNTIHESHSARVGAGSVTALSAVGFAWFRVVATHSYLGCDSNAAALEKLQTLYRKFRSQHHLKRAATRPGWPNCMTPGTIAVLRAESRSWGSTVTPGDPESSETRPGGAVCKPRLPVHAMKESNVLGLLSEFPRGSDDSPRPIDRMGGCNPRYDRGITAASGRVRRCVLPLPPMRHSAAWQSSPRRTSPAWSAP